ncbi:MAG: NAD(P)H-binding protein [Parvibaculaceae bacterium]
MTRNTPNNTNKTGQKTLLVIGATGGIGGEVAKAFARGGWQVRALARKPKAAARRFAHLGVAEWRKGDALNARDVRRAAGGVDAIFHGANPPGYKKWRERAIPMLANAIKAAKTADARLLFPGNVYNFGPDAWPLLAETSPQNPVTEKGKIRVEMEQTIAEAGIRSLIVRAGDFFGAHAPGSWLSNAIVTPGKPVKSVTYPGDHAKGHAWAYLPDLAETFRRLMDEETRLEQHGLFHFGGHGFEQGGDMARAIADAAGDGSLKVKPLPWWILRLVAPFATTFRELLEMRYLWQETMLLDNSRLVAFLGEEPHTPLNRALQETLSGLGCLSPRPEPSRLHEVPA